MGKKRVSAERRGWPKPESDEPAPADPFAVDGGGVATDAAPEPAKKRGRKPKQQFFAGTEPATIKELEDAAQDYVAARDERMGLTELEAERKKLLAELMKKHKLATYAFDGQMIEYTHVDEDQVKVKKVRAAKDSPQAT